MNDRWSAKINTITEDFINTFGTLNFEQLNFKPDDNNWSIAQIINHLIITNETYYPIVDELQNGNYKIPFIGKVKILVDFFGNLVLKTVQPDTKRKVKTFNIWKPPSSNIPGDILEKFKNHHSELIKVISKCGNLLDKKTVISSPANKNIVYKLETAFDIIVAHEQRHYLQAKKLLSFF
jgi:hypothetical protein